MMSIFLLDDDNTRILLFEMRIGMNEFDHRILGLLRQERERPENSGLNRNSNPDLCDAGALLHQLRLLIDPHKDQLPVGLITQLVEHGTGLSRRLLMQR